MNTERILRAKNKELASRLEAAEETIHAIQRGAVDAFVLEELGRYRVFMLEGADRPYRLFMDDMQQGVATVDRYGVIAYCNRRLHELIQAPHDDVVGQSFVERIAPDDRSRCEGLISEARQTGSGRGEVRLQQSDGACLPVYLAFNALPDDCGGLIGVFVTDLTIEKHRDQLATAQESLRLADRRKNEFLAMVSHELRNPLAPIRSAVDILRVSCGDPETVRTTSEMLDRQVGRMVRLVDDLLDVSRIARNRVELRVERVDLASVLAHAVECARPALSAFEHHIDVRTPDEPIYVDGDPIRLTQIFTNLLDNACKYMDPGGKIFVELQVGPEPQTGQADVIVHVRDEGMGIAADQLDRIFELFARVDSSLERAQPGLGIGLTLVTSLVELHGGRVEAHSAGLGCGSEFSVFLPRTAGAAPDRPVTEPAAASKTSYRILVVDDNQDSAESLATLLTLMGHETFVAFDGVAAVNAAESIGPDVVLLDIGMPKRNGYDTCREIRRQPWSTRMILIAQTGWGQVEDQQRTEDSGFDGHVVKPVNLEALLKMLTALSTNPRRPDASNNF